MLPPQATDIEGAILGACLSDSEAIHIVSEILKPEHFYIESNGIVYSAMFSLVSQFRPVDYLTVFEELRKSGNLDKVGGSTELVKLSADVYSSANVEYHARIVLQKYLSRELIKIGSLMKTTALEDIEDVFDQLDTAETKLFALTVDHLSKDYVPVASAAIEFQRHIEHIRNRPDKLTGVPSGYPDIDKLTNGWQPGTMIIVGARPSIGKSAFALNLAYNAATHNSRPTGVAVFSLEMTRREIMGRLVSMDTHIDGMKIKRGDLSREDAEKISKSVEKFLKVPIFIDDNASLNVFELRAKARRLKRKHDIGLVIVDYLQLMSDKRDGNKQYNREQEISQISRGLKLLSKDLEIPVIALSQLSRGVESRADKRPVLSDLRESGSLEQDADIIVFPFRPDKREIEDDPSLMFSSEIIIAKHRDGGLDSFPMFTYNNIQRWMDPEQSAYYERSGLFSNSKKKEHFYPFDDESDPFL